MFGGRAPEATFRLKTEALRSGIGRAPEATVRLKTEALRSGISTPLVVATGNFVHNLKAGGAASEYQGGRGRRWGRCAEQGPGQVCEVY